MTVGCYVIGDIVIHTSETISRQTHGAPKGSFSDYLSLVSNNVKEKLECLVIVDTILNDLSRVRKIYENAQKHASEVHIINPLIALLQNVLSKAHTSITSSTKKIAAVVYLTEEIYIHILEKCDSRSFHLISSKTLKDLNEIRDFLNLMKPDLFLYVYNSEKRKFQAMKSGLLNYTKSKRITMIPFYLNDPIDELAEGGYQKALCISDKTKKFEVINSTFGIMSGSVILIPAGTTFPTKTVVYSGYNQNSNISLTGTLSFVSRVSTTKKEKNKIIRKWNTGVLPIKLKLGSGTTMINEYGLLEIKANEVMVIPMPLTMLSFGSTSVVLIKNNSIIRTNYTLTTHTSHTSKLPFTNDMQKLLQYMPLSLHITILCDDPAIFNDVDKTPTVLMLPSYYGILQYCMGKLNPQSKTIIVFVCGKMYSQYFVLCRHQYLRYSIVKMAPITSTLIDDTILNGALVADVFYLTETGTKTFLCFLGRPKAYLQTLHIDNLDEAILEGGAVFGGYGQPLLWPFVNIDEYLPHSLDSNLPNPQIPSVCELEVIFHHILSKNDPSMFPVQPLVILIPKDDFLHFYFFLQFEQSFGLTFAYNTPMGSSISKDLCKFSPYIVVVGPKKLKFEEGILPVTFDFGDIEKLTEECLIFLKRYPPCILPNAYYYDMIQISMKNDVVSKANCEKKELTATVSIEEKRYPLTIEYKDGKCRALRADGSSVKVNEMDDEWVPMYISFTSESPCIGKIAQDAVKKSPEAVIYDIIDFLGATSSACPSFEGPKTYTIAAIDASRDSKLGFKVKTFQGFRVISPEMALSIYLLKFIKAFEDQTKEEVQEIRFRAPSFTPRHQESFKKVEKLLKKTLVFHEL